MLDLPPEPPRSTSDLFDSVRAVIEHGTYQMPEGSRYGGTGAPGRFLEDLIGSRAGSAGWELRWYTDRTQLITLFQKEADGPNAIMRDMVRRYGWKDKRGCLSFRHTIKGNSKRFKVVDSCGKIVVCPLSGNGPVPYWNSKDLMSAAGAKLRRLILVKGRCRHNEIRFLQADAYQPFRITDFVNEVLRGSVAIDFDCREQEPGSAGLRNHGTKFRVSPLAICRLYLKTERIYHKFFQQPLPLKY